MRKLFTAFAMALMIGGCTYIPPGYVGIKVDKFGGNKGVEEIPVVTGTFVYNPWTTSFFEYPTFVQTVVWTRSPDEGSSTNEEFSFNDNQGMIFTGDVNASYSIDPLKVPAFYVKYRSDDLKVYTHTYLKNAIRDALNKFSRTYTTEELYATKTTEFIEKVKAEVNSLTGPDGVKIDTLGLIGPPRPPGKVAEAIIAKQASIQKAAQAVNELAEATAQANKKVAFAKGEADANMLLAKSISPELIQWRNLENLKTGIEKWNGILPTYMAGALPIAFADVKAQAPQ